MERCYQWSNLWSESSATEVECAETIHDFSAGILSLGFLKETHCFRLSPTALCMFVPYPSALLHDIEKGGLVIGDRAERMGYSFYMFHIPLNTFRVEGKFIMNGNYILRRSFSSHSGKF